MNKGRSRVSAGYTMIEMMAMLTVLTTVMSVTLSWLHASIKFSSAVKDRTHVHQQLNRLSEDLRGHIARAENIAVDGNVLELNSDASEVRYTIKDDVLERQEKAKTPDGPDGVRVESFRIGGDVVARWGADELPDWVSLTIRHKPLMRASEGSSTSIRSLETPKLEWHLRAGPRRLAQ